MQFDITPAQIEQIVKEAESVPTQPHPTWHGFNIVGVPGSVQLVDPSDDIVKYHTAVAIHASSRLDLEPLIRLVEEHKKHRQYIIHLKNKEVLEKVKTLFYKGVPD